MFRSRASLADALREELVHLSDDHVVYELDDAWFAVGPTGLFVLGEAERNAARDTALRLIGVAAATRESLIDVLTWVPFVAPVVVTPEDVEDLPCLSITPTFLHAVIGTGPQIVDDATIDTLRQLDLVRLT